MSTPIYQRCGHVAAAPEGFPCPHSECWANGLLTVVSLDGAPDEVWERLLVRPATGAPFFGWRKQGEPFTISAPTSGGDVSKGLAVMSRVSDGMGAEAAALDVSQSALLGVDRREQGFAYEPPAPEPKSKKGKKS